MNKTTDQNSTKERIAPSFPYTKREPWAIQPFSLPRLVCRYAALTCEISLPKSPAIAFPGSSCLTRDSPTRTCSNVSVESAQQKREMPNFILRGVSWLDLPLWPRHSERTKYARAWTAQILLQPETGQRSTWMMCDKEYPSHSRPHTMLQFYIQNFWIAISVVIILALMNYSLEIVFSWCHKETVQLCLK